MRHRYRAPGGWRVEIVRLECTPDRRDGTWIRVTLYGTHVADVRSIDELSRYVDLADLVEDEDGLGASGTRVQGADVDPLQRHTCS